MQKEKSAQLTKRVQFTAKDANEQIATGIVMVPNKVDLQGDFVRPDTIQNFAEQFEALEDVGDAGGGVMHAVWPDEHISLTENATLVESEVIGGEEAPAGAWIQDWKFHDSELWGLVEDDVLSGYSIGAADVEWSASMSQDEMPDDVDVAEDYPDDEPVWELRSGIMREVSTVDIPAVPDAQILDTKSDAIKQLARHLGNHDAFLEEAVQRGHSEDEAERLWEYLNRAIEVDGAGTPGKTSIFERASKAFLSALTGSDDDESAKSSEALDAEKEGRTLSQATRTRLMAAHDAVEDALEADLEFDTNRFTDNDSVDFDIADYGKEAPTEHAPGGDTPDFNDDNTKDMGDDPDDPMADAPEWGKALYDQTEKNSDRIDDLSEKVSDDDPDDPEKAWDDAPAWAKAMRDEQKDNRERIDDLAEAAGKSQQLFGGDPEEPEGRTKADVLGLPGGN